MHIAAFVVEDARGRESVELSFRLGEIAIPVGSNLRPPFGNEARSGLAGSFRTRIRLDVYAPDEGDDTVIALALKTFQEALPFTSHSRSTQGTTTLVFQADADLEAPRFPDLVRKLAEAILTRLGRRKVTTPLRVARLDLTDFRGVGSLRLDFSTPPSVKRLGMATTVLVGANGSGKTTLLDAIVLMLAMLEGEIRAKDRGAGFAPPPRDIDITNGSLRCKIALSVELSGSPTPWRVAGEVARDDAAGLGGGAFAWELNDAFIRGVDSIRRSLQEGHPSLPLAVFYPVNRAVIESSSRLRTPHEFSPINAYDGALGEGSSNFRLFFEWFRMREDAENEQRIHDAAYRDGQLEAVRRAIEGVLPGFSELRVQRQPQQRILVKKGQWTLDVDQLSDGEKCLLAMTGDLARRLAMANPLLDDPLEGSAIVLIDELELHLHPAWQRRVLPALEKTFPNSQLIVSTHSPEVLRHVSPESIRVLSLAKEGVTVTSPGAAADGILEEVFGIQER